MGAIVDRARSSLFQAWQRNIHPRDPPRQERYNPRQLVDVVDDVVEDVVDDVTVVRTISLVEVVNSLGEPIRTQTFLTPPSETPELDSLELTTTPVPILEETTPSSLPPPPAETSEGLASEVAEPSSTPISSSESISASQDISLTSAPLSSSSAFPTLSLSPVLFSNSSLPANATVQPILGTLSTTLSFTSSGSSSNSALSSAGPTSTTSLILDAAPTEVSGNEDGGSGGVADSTTSAAPSPTNESSDDSEAPPELIAGGVVASFAGVAILLMIALFALRWKKRRGGALLSGSGSGSTSRGILPSSGPDSGPSMTHRTLPFTVPAALSRLSVGGAKSQEPETQEKGFYKVAGRKLPSVLVHGGDGFNDPRQSVVSGVSSYYGENGYDPADGGSPRLALGSPMRPISGIPIFRTGPARTPVTEENPFADPWRPSTAQQDEHAGPSGHAGPSRFNESV